MRIFDSWWSTELFVAVLLIATLLACKFLSRQSAALRHQLLAACLIGALALPLARFLPAVELASPLVRALIGIESEANAAPARERSAALLDTARTAPNVGIDPRRSSRLPVGALFWLWPTIAVLLGVRTLRGLGSASRLVAHSSALPASSNWRLAFDELTQEGSTRRVSLRQSSALRFPANLGWRRPVVLVPSSALGWSLERCRNVLRHELAHVERADWPIQTLGRLACAVHWWNPLVWWSHRELLLFAEEACDDAVVLQGASGPGFAGELVLAARAAPSLPPTPAAVLALMSTGLERRIHRLLNPRSRRQTMSRPVVSLSIVAALLLLLGTGTVRWVEARETSADPLAQAIIEAAERGDQETVQRLLDAGVSVDALADGDGTPLIAAARGGRRDLVRRLLELGADPDLVASGDGSPLLVAAERGDLDTLRLLVAWGARVDLEAPGDGNPLIAAARAGQLSAAELLLDAGADVDRIVLGDETPLIQAAGSGDIGMVRLLLDRGADPNLTVYQDGGGLPLRGGPRSPLVQARRNGHQEIVQLLMERGAS